MNMTSAFRRLPAAQGRSLHCVPLWRTGWLIHWSSVLLSSSACDLRALWSPRSHTAPVYSNEAERCPGLFLDVELLLLWVYTHVDITCLNTRDRRHTEGLVCNHPNGCWCYLPCVVHPVVVWRATKFYFVPEFFSSVRSKPLFVYLFKTGSPYIALKLFM